MVVVVVVGQEGSRSPKRKHHEVVERQLYMQTDSWEPWVSAGYTWTLSTACWASDRKQQQQQERGP